MSGAAREPRERTSLPARITEVAARALSIRNVIVPGLLGWLAVLAGLSPFALKMVGGGLFGMEKPSWWSMFPGAAFGVAVAAMIGALVALGRANRPKDGAAPMRVEAGKLVIERGGAQDEIPLEQIRAGAIFPRGDGADVTIDLTRGRLLTASFASVADAEELLAAAGLDASQRRYRTSLGSTRARPFASAGAFFASAVLAVLLWPAGGGVITPLAPAVWVALTAAMIGASALLTRSPEVVVGADGVTIRRRLRQRVLRFDQITAVSGEGASLVLTLTDGSKEKIDAGLVATERIPALAARIRDAKAAVAGSSAAPRGAALLARAGRSLADWRAAIVELVQRSKGYRDVSLSPEDLERALGAPESTAEQRIGAALALADLGAEEARPRLRIAAEVSASPKLRAALEKIADTGIDEEAVAEALASEEEETGARLSPPRGEPL